jgi:hypothetical protein
MEPEDICVPCATSAEEDFNAQVEWQAASFLSHPDIVQ